MFSSDFTVDVDAIKKYMIDLHIDSITELSERSGVSRATLSGLFKRKTKPSSDVMYKLVLCLNIPPHVAGEIFFKPNLRIA